MSLFDFLSWWFYRVSENMPLYDILNEFQKGHSHIAVVYKDLNEKASQNGGQTELSPKKGKQKV